MTLVRNKSNLTYWTGGLHCCNERWETAYNRFETQEEEIAKFQKRLNALGVSSWDKSWLIADLFCGRGSNLIALEQLGFKRLCGVDLSPDLLVQYEGTAEVYVGDCTNLKFEDRSLDVVIVQGGMHHLPRLPEDLEACIAEIHRVLAPTGKAVFVEPWLTPFLRFVHTCCKSRLLRRLNPKLDALAIMIEEEQETYFNWLSRADQIRKIAHKYFATDLEKMAWGKWNFVGTPR